jgi:DNA-binding transcriptional LysR family regulator
MELRDLHALIAIAETGSLSAAARKLRLTQPALTASLQRLERTVGVLLVKRHSRGAILTEEGQFVLHKARDVLHEVSQIAQVHDKLALAPAGEIHLGLPTTVAGGLIPTLIPMVQQRYPKIRLHVVEAMSGVLQEQLQLGRLDLAVVFESALSAGLRSTPLLTETIYLLVPANHPLAALPVVDLKTVSALALVLPSTANSIRKHLEVACLATDLTLTVLADVDSLPGLLGLVRAGYCTVLPKYLAKGEIDTDGLDLCRCRIRRAPCRPHCRPIAWRTIAPRSVGFGNSKMQTRTRQPDAAIAAVKMTAFEVDPHQCCQR